MYLRSDSAGKPFIYNDLFYRLKAVKNQSQIRDIEILYDVCRIFFGSTENIRMVDYSIVKKFTSKK